ncbi:MAG: tRNA lysidine(34) synthetase TilS [Pseudomonadota bacterium]
MADPISTAPVSDQEYANALAALTAEPPLAVAVSGGADSMALLHLTHRWRQAQAPQARLWALTVDHGLREAARAEAQQVSAFCRTLGIDHRILSWTGEKPKSDIQAAARRARYALMHEFCTRHGVRSLLLGHQLEDQAETFLLRLGRGSGVDGLSAMAPAMDWMGVRYLRPLLGFSGQRLRATLDAAGQKWIEDPSNQDPRFMRVRMRAALAEFQAAGITPARLAATAQRMRRVRAALERSVLDLMASAVQWDQAGYARLTLEALFDAPEEIGLRTLAQLLMAVGGQEYPPRMQRLERLFEWLRRRPVMGGRTLAGCRILPRRGVMLIVREPVAVGAEVTLLPGQPSFWDNRFRVCLSYAEDATGAEIYKVQHVGAAGLSQIRKSGVKCRPPAIVCHATPGLWRGAKLIAAPLLGYSDPGCEAGARFEARFSPRYGLLPVTDSDQEKRAESLALLL